MCPFLECQQPLAQVSKVRDMTPQFKLAAHKGFGATQFNYTAQLGGGVQLFTSRRRTAIDLGYKYPHISNANLGNQNPGLDSHMLLSLFW